MTHVTVLIVDEDQALLASCSKHLFEQGFTAIPVQTCEQALEVARLKSLDAILVEINIQGGRGFTLCQELRNSPSTAHVPLILTSRIHSLSHQLERAVRDAQASGYLLKPFGASGLINCLEEHVDVTALRGHAPARAGAAAEASDPEGVRGLLREALPEIPSLSAMQKGPVVLALSQLKRRLATGLLYLREDTYKTVFYLQEGVPVFARTTLPRLRLTSLLAEEGRLSTAQVDHAVSLARSFGGSRWFEEILLGLGYLSGDEIRAAVSLQIQELIKRSVFETQPAFSFFDGDLPVPHEATAKADLDQVLYDGILAISDLEKLSGFLPPRNAILTRSSRASQLSARYNLSRFESEFLNMIDGQKSFQEICALGRRTMGNIETLLLAFLDARLVTLSRTATVTADNDKGEDHRSFTVSRGHRNEGDLGEQSFASVLSSLHLARKTGVLVLKSGEACKTLHLEDGEIVFARSNLFEDRIGRVLVDANLVEEHHVEDAASESGPSLNRRIGGVLMDRGLVTFDQLYWAGQFQVLRIIRSLFEWSKGSFEFQERELPTWVAATPPLDTANLLLEEFRQCPLERLGACALLTPETWIWPSHQEAEAGHALQLNDLEEGVLAWVQEPMSFHAILETGLAEPSQLIRCVQGLLAVGLLDRTAEGDDSLPPMGVLPQDTRGPDLTN